MGIFYFGDAVSLCRRAQLPHRYAVPPFFLCWRDGLPAFADNSKVCFLITRNATARRSIFNPRVASVKIGDGEYPRGNRHITPSVGWRTSLPAFADKTRFVPQKRAMLRRGAQFLILALLR